MKKASNILLMVAGIIDIIVGAIVIATCWLALFATLPWGVFLLLAGIFALVARKKQNASDPKTKTMMIVVIVFTVLGADLIGLTGGILGLIDVIQHPNQPKEEPQE